MAKEAFDIRPDLRDEVIGVILAGLESPPQRLDRQACAQIRSWCEVNLVGVPEKTIRYGVPEVGLPQFIALLRTGIARMRVSRAARELVETWCREEAAYFERTYQRPCTPEIHGDDPPYQ
jgi:hypothetical protein